MALYRIADLNIDIQNKHEYTSKLCRNYKCDDENAVPDFSVSATAADYEKDKAYLPDATDGYLESLSIYREIARRILDYNGIILHSSVVEIDGRAYAFAARSGTGKSTHSRLWTKVFPDRAKIINGDKPLLRYIDGKLFIYGTPWCGKEGYNVNTKAVLGSVCFLERAQNNYIEKLNKNDAVKRIFDQLLMPETKNQAAKFFDMVELIVENSRFYLLHCNMDDEAAYVAYDGMNKK